MDGSLRLPEQPFGGREHASGAIGAIALTRTRQSGADKAVRRWIGEMSQPGRLTPELTSTRGGEHHQSQQRHECDAPEPRRSRTSVNGLGEESVATRGPECADGAREPFGLDGWAVSSPSGSSSSPVAASTRK
jgi:hypothetical protein